MKRVLITGEGSFVGGFVEAYLKQWPDRYEVKTIGTRNGEWERLGFHSFDTVYHVAGLAHVDVGKASEEVKAQYYAVNTDLAVRVAKKARTEGVGQFIFMSSAIVYGDSAPIGKEKVIKADTPCEPSNFYGDSKVQAEKGLLELRNERFHVVILRCPMIYGRGSKGNFPTLEKLAEKMPVFPKVENRRSMLYVGNLAEFVRLMIEEKEDGIFWPCNREQSNTGELIRMIAKCHGRRIILVPGFGWALKLLGHFNGYVNKAFGNLVYEDGLGDYKAEYRLFDLAESIAETEFLDS